VANYAAVVFDDDFVEAFNHLAERFVDEFNFGDPTLAEAPALGRHPAVVFTCKDNQLRAEFVGHGSLTADLQGTLALKAVLAGQGSLTATLQQTFGMDAVLTGHGSLTAFLSSALVALLRGHGSLTANLAGDFGMRADLLGHGSLTPTLRQVQAMVAVLKGAGFMVVDVDIIGQSLIAVMRGRGSLTAASLGGDFGMAATLRGTGVPVFNLGGDFTMTALMLGLARLRGHISKPEDDVPEIPEIDVGTGGIWWTT
jgi:hypothetical protein